MTHRMLFAVLLGSVLFVEASSASAQTDWKSPGAQRDAVCQGSCGGGCGPCPSPQREAARLENEQKRAQKEEANTVNEQGIAAWNRGEWGVALERFSKAHYLNADSKIILTNYLNAIHKVGQEDIARGDWENAKNEFQRAVYLNPKSDEFKRLLEFTSAKAQEQRDREIARRQDDRAYDTAMQSFRLGKEAADLGDYVLAAINFKAAASQYPAEPAFLQNYAWALTKRGDQVWKGADTWAEALKFYIAASNADPGNAYAKKMLEQARVIQEAEERERLERTAQEQRQAQQTAGTAVVDATNLPSGLSKDQERAIASAYQHAPPGVIERVEKGFQAVNKHDWAVARAWFQDALLRDPTSRGLQHLVALAEYSLATPQPATKKPVLPVIPASNPDKAEIDAFFQNFRDGFRRGGAGQTSDAMRRYIATLTPEEFHHLLDNTMPRDADLVFFFDLLNPNP